jgi:glyoxylase-like metal-dependent hydrolase (beta-lactamase superfamily II)
MVTLAKNDRVQLERKQLGFFGTNTYLLVRQKTGCSVIIDAPGKTNKILEGLEGTNPKYILMTHSHSDHVGGLLALQSALFTSTLRHTAERRGCCRFREYSAQSIAYAWAYSRQLMFFDGKVPVIRGYLIPRRARQNLVTSRF